jgi:hypothetical protein
MNYYQHDQQLDEEWLNNTQKHRINDKFDHSAVPLQTTKFEFGNINCHPNYNNRKYVLMQRTQIANFKNNNEKPIFIVSGKGPVINQKQQIVHHKSRFHQLANNFSQSRPVTLDNTI